jgi:pimeloyl-ACP methyl ester carboxylesterase
VDDEVLRHPAQRRGATQNEHVPARLSSRRRRFLLALAAVVGVLAVVSVVAVVRAGDAPPRLPAAAGSASPTAADEDVPVILVHGLGGTTDNMTAIAARLRRDDRDPVSVSLPNNGLVDIDMSVREVDRAVRATGARVVDLVGYSLGGVVVRAWVASESEWAVARRVVTLASPHHGAQLADTAAVLDPTRCVEACAQLRPGSQFLRDLNSDDETPGTASWTAVWTTRDQTVTPVESARLEGAVNVRLQDVCADSEVGHGSINRNPLPLGLVVLALRGELPTAPPPSQCPAIRALGA